MLVFYIFLVICTLENELFNPRLRADVGNFIVGGKTNSGAVKW